MSHAVVLKCPPDFHTLGRNDVCVGQAVEAHWHLWRKGRLTDNAIANCMEFLTHRTYSGRLLERFKEAAGEAIPYVAKRTHPEVRLRISLLRFTKEGERCVALTVDSLPLPGLAIEIPSPTDPDLLQPNLRRHFAHARILAHVDGYMIVSNSAILQLMLSWSETVHAGGNPNG